MNRLLEIGFAPAGHWTYEAERLNFQLARHSTQTNILYAFVCDGQVKYVGKTIRALATRMSGYKTPGRTQTTNINNHRRIKDLLLAGAAVEILALPDTGLLHYGQFHLNLAAALEDSIIQTLKPTWNGGMKESELVAGAEEEVVLEPPQYSGGFAFTLQPTYYRTGFFNVGVAYQNLLGADGEVIELFLGNEDQPILGSINRRANTNDTPRIMGGVGLKNWFKATALENSKIEVLVISPTAIRLSAHKG